MKYEILKNSDKGILIDRTPILQDVRDTFEVSFLLPDDAGYIALFKGADGIEYRKTIKDGICKIPKELLNKEQYAELFVCRIDGEKIFQAWGCEPIKITAFLHLRKSQWEISGGMTDTNAYARMVELEKLYAQTIEDLASLKADTSRHRNETAGLVAELKLELRNQTEALERLEKDNVCEVAAYNTAIETINEITERVAALEKSYDPLQI